MSVLAIIDLTTGRFFGWVWLADLHLWRLGPGHLGAILSVVTAAPARRGFLSRSLEQSRPVFARNGRSAQARRRGGVLMRG